MNAITVVSKPNGSWKYGRRCEIRVHDINVSATGMGYADRCTRIDGDYNRNSSGSRSGLGQAIAALAHEFSVATENINL